MPNAIWEFITSGISPLIGVLNNLGTSTLGFFGYEIAILVMAVFFAHGIKKGMDVGFVGWIVSTLILYGFFQSIGLKGVQ